MFSSPFFHLEAAVNKQQAKKNINVSKKSIILAEIQKYSHSNG